MIHILQVFNLYIQIWSCIRLYPIQPSNDDDKTWVKHCKCSPIAHFHGLSMGGYYYFMENCNVVTRLDCTIFCDLHKKLLTRTLTNDHPCGIAFQGNCMAYPAGQRLGHNAGLASLLSTSGYFAFRIYFTKVSWAHNANIVNSSVAVTWKIMIQSGHNFAHDTTAQLSWHVQNYDLIRSLETWLKDRNLSKNFVMSK